MSVSGRSSSCSIVQEENLVQLMNRTPKTPIKNGCQITPRKSESKRSLFQSCSPARSDDLGLMTPLSPSSCSSNQSLGSPSFSPNGVFTTPPRTPQSTASPVRCSPRLAMKKIEVKSSLFPDLKIFSPKSHKTPRTVISKMITPQSQSDSLDSFKSLTTPMRKFHRRGLFNESVVAETDTSPSISSQESQESQESAELNAVSDKPTILGIKPLTCDSFYGPTQKPQKVRTKLFIDTLEKGSGVRELTRSVSKESLSSNRSFVSGGTRKKTENHGSRRRHRSRSNSDHKRSGTRSRGIQPGVWHNIKKPKQIKKIQKSEKPLISPKSRLSKILNPPGKEIKVKEKSLFKEHPRKRVAHSNKRSRTNSDDSSIIDSFPDPLIKRKKLPTPQFNVHPAICSTSKLNSPEQLTPDPNKKFVKYGQMRKATFTLNDSVKLQISDGVMKLQTPKKRRKLYSGRKDMIEDFNDFEEGDSGLQNSIQGILSILEDEKDSSRKKNIKSNTSSENHNDSMLQFSKQTPKKGVKGQRSPLKTVSNLPTMILHDFESDEDIENLKSPVNDKSNSEITLEKTGNMISYMTNILVNDEEGESMIHEDFERNENENSHTNSNKLYSLFYKRNWNKNSEPICHENTTNVLSSTKKAIVPDDQYLLDAGQKSIGIITCKKCGVMYQAGDFADEATHKNFHSHLPELKYTGWNNERVVGRYPDGRIIMVLNADPKIWWQKVSKIVEIVDQDLGFPEATVQSLFYKTVYLYISEKAKQIVGCLIAEECKVAYKMFPPLEGVEIDSCSKDPSPCKVGISRIWTALSHRRKGVATRMIECLQKTFIFGNVVSLDDIAFSVPSPSGKLLAQKVTGKLDFLVYGFP